MKLIYITKRTIAIFIKGSVYETKKIILLAYIFILLFMGIILLIFAIITNYPYWLSWGAALILVVSGWFFIMGIFESMHKRTDYIPDNVHKN